VNLQEAKLDEAADMPAGFVCRGANVGEALGRELIGCGLYELHPDEQLWPYHFHLGNEEWAIVVAGEPTVRTPDGERGLRPGDIVAFPEGEDGAHTFFNRTEELARVAIFSTLNSQTLPVYPDSRKVSAAGHVFRFADAVDYWDGEESRA
jgi:uncharacterized cupin superfamily protein